MKQPASLIFMPLSTVFSLVTQARRAAYQHGLFKTSHPGVPVISVGNITTGGTGKTPLVEWVCRKIAEKQPEKICVLTRGYGRASPETQVLVSDGEQIFAAESESGDEALLLARNLLGVAAVVANRDRLAAARWAIENLNTDVFVLDDGFQHLRIARDLNIVAIDATDPWGSGEFLPSGKLREPLSSLARADCVVVTRTDQTNDWRTVAKTVQSHARDVPIFSSRMVTKRFRELNGATIQKAEIMSQPLLAFCGVGNADSFFRHIAREGFRLVATRKFRDHHQYQSFDIQRLVQEAKDRGATALFTTAKDAIKLESSELPLPCYVLDITIEIDDEGSLIEMIRGVVRREVNQSEARR
jgi:tetraacyldisaccharide 4'-kinase